MIPEDLIMHSSVYVKARGEPGSWNYHVLTMGISLYNACLTHTYDTQMVDGSVDTRDNENMMTVKQKWNFQANPRFWVLVVIVRQKGLYSSIPLSFPALPIFHL